MSNLNDIGLIMAILIANVAVGIYVLAQIDDANYTIVTGVRGGVPVSIEYRRMMLFYTTIA